MIKIESNDTIQKINHILGFKQTSKRKIEKTQIHQTKGP